MFFVPHWSRRTFIKASLLTMLAVFGGTAAWSRELIEESPVEGKLSLLNTHTLERLDVTYRDPSGAYDPAALESINRLLRCHYTDEMHDIDLRTLEILNLVDNKFGGGNEIHIISGYRSPAYNEMLRKRSRRVAKHSLHMEGKAIDLRIPGVPLAKLRQAAVSLALGGVGYYPKTNFVHLDSGEFRTW
jgi:uncharacterized protein YcbK (DUF882 family)